MSENKTDWPEIGDIVVNHGAGKPAVTTKLAGQTIAFTADNSRVSLSFDADGVRWEESGTSTYVAIEAFEVRPDLFFIDCDLGQAPRGMALVLDMPNGRILIIDILAPRPDAPDSVIERVARHGSQSAVQVTYRQGCLEGFIGKASDFSPSTDLVGKQFRYRYSDTHLYDHLYLSDRYYCWFCREGPDAGLGDFDECDYFAIGPLLTLVCWREKLLPCVGITLEDHGAMRTVGKIFGADSSTGATANSTVGADIIAIADISGGL